MYRQGDVFLRKVAKTPSNLKKVARDRGRLILAYGEVTGHAHVIDAPAAEATLLTDEQNRRFLNLVTEAPLVHEEHATITLPPGDYEVIRQREWSDQDEPVLVRD